MSKIFISGLVNMETTVPVKAFPVSYFPIDYPFFGVNTNISGVAYNLAKAFQTLGDEVELVSMLGNDFGAEVILQKMKRMGISAEYVKKTLKQTPNSVVLYDAQGRRSIYCDLKDIQEKQISFEKEMYADSDIVVACNINFNRELLKKAKEDGKRIATDVHVLSDVSDTYNRDFMQYADILFLSDENIDGDYRAFLKQIEKAYGNEIIVLGMGKNGALLYEKRSDMFLELPAVTVGKIVNTVGAGDALFSAFIHYYAKGEEAGKALEKAQIFASYKIGADGASEGFVSEETIETTVLR